MQEVDIVIRPGISVNGNKHHILDRLEGFSYVGTARGRATSAPQCQYVLLNFQQATNMKHRIPFLLGAAACKCRVAINLPQTSMHWVL